MNTGGGGVDVIADSQTVFIQEATEEEIMQFVADRVAPYKKVRELEFVETIPKSLAGKILRRELVDQERAKGEG